MPRSAKWFRLPFVASTDIRDSITETWPRSHMPAAGAGYDVCGVMHWDEDDLLCTFMMVDSRRDVQEVDDDDDDDDDDAAADVCR